jgi:hypothetical protein
MKDFDLKKYLGDNKLLKEEISVKSGDPIIFDGRKGTFVKHGQPGYSVFIDIDDEYFETSAKSISMDPDYDYTERTSVAIDRVNEQEDPNKKKYTEEEWKYELDLNAKMAARLIAHQAMGNADAVWEDLVADLVAMQKQSRIPTNIEFFKDYIKSQENNELPNSSSGSFFTGLTDIDGLLSAMNFEEYDEETDEELYTDEEYDKAVAYHNMIIKQEVPDMFKY